MAEIVIGIGTSHTPMISMGAEHWKNHVASWDVHLPGYSDATANAPDWLRERVTPEKAREVYSACQEHLDYLRDRLKSADPDVVVVFGDDQEELFLHDGVPTLALYGGHVIQDLPEKRDLPAAQRAAEWAFHGSEPEPIFTHSQLGRHIGEVFAAAGLGFTYMERQPDGRSIGHAFTFITRRLAEQPRWKMVPIWLNTYYPPNQITPSLAFEVGKLVRDAVESWSGSERVAIVASGGLSHFFIDEDFDTEVLRLLASRDEDALCRLENAKLQSGTSETLNWVAAAGALSGFEVSWQRYLPAYRSLASTGVGVAALVWTPKSEH